MSAEQKVVIVTGASQGIGAGLVKSFREKNYRVVANSRSIRPSDDRDILAVAGDISEPETAKRVVEQALSRFGRIDSLVNNAGIFIGKRFTDSKYDLKSLVRDICNSRAYQRSTQRNDSNLTAERFDAL